MRNLPQMRVAVCPPASTAKRRIFFAEKMYWPDKILWENNFRFCFRASRFANISPLQAISKRNNRR